MIDALFESLIGTMVSNCRGHEHCSRVCRYFWTLGRDRSSTSPSVPTRRPFRELLASYVAILDELRHRSVIRTCNSPLGDLAETLAQRAYGGELAPNSAKSYDLLTSDGRRIQVKARTVEAADKRSQTFSAVRSWSLDALRRGPEYQ